MTDQEIDRAIAEVKEMARRLGCEFVPDPKKIAILREAERKREAANAEYRRQNRHYDRDGYCDNPGRGY